MKSIYVATISVLFAALSQIFLKFSLSKIGKISIYEISELPKIMIQNPLLILAIFLLIFASVFWLMALSRANLNLIYPFLSLSYVFVAIFSFILFKETLSFFRIIGIAIVVVGVNFLAKS